MKEIVVLGSATDNDRGSWVVDITGTQYVRSSAIRAFGVADPGTVTKEEKFAVVAFLSSPEEYIVVAAGFDDSQAAVEALVQAVS